MPNQDLSLEDPINKQTYLSTKVIDYYSQYSDLQPPEKTIFQMLAPMLPQAKMLDVGVGAGRTTEYFAPLVKSYTAMDFSAGMIERCKNKYSAKFPEARFALGDAKDLQEFENEKFDFILFSFNGVDYMPIASRMQFLQKARRLLVPGGYLCFSTHNIFSLRRLTLRSAFQFRLNLFGALAKVARRMKVRMINASAFRTLETSDFVFFNDGTHDFGLKQCFVRPSFQIKMLRECGYQTIRAFDLGSGKEHATEKDICSTENGWIYFLCS
jgi:ubiquinone/menaquinone biosynthesis C-methylase UbiE